MEDNKLAERVLELCPDLMGMCRTSEQVVTDRRVVLHLVKRLEDVLTDVKQWQQRCINANAEIERLNERIDVLHEHDGTCCPLCVMENEIKRLTELTENDRKEIGSYREGTGLRGESQALSAEIERLADERDRQYDQNVEQQMQIAKLQAALEDIAETAPTGWVRDRARDALEETNDV